MERAALQRLLADIRQKRVDVVVVYKVDRLTRSLADFAKMVEVFDQHGVSFVAVTQQFNTTTSMGRLTLNVLLSFAQFEREVTGERIRDKISASKRKGMWMGGTVPVGYDAVIAGWWSTRPKPRSSKKYILFIWNSPRFACSNRSSIAAASSRRYGYRSAVINQEDSPFRAAHCMNSCPIRSTWGRFATEKSVIPGSIARLSSANRGREYSSSCPNGRRIHAGSRPTWFRICLWANCSTKPVNHSTSAVPPKDNDGIAITFHAA